MPLVRFKPGGRKDDVAAVQRERFTKPEGVVCIGIAQEKAQAFKAAKRVQGHAVGVDYSRQPGYGNYYSFYLHDQDFGPGFSKVCRYAPFGLKVSVNGHEWAKPQLRQEGLAFAALDNGFLSCADPARLQAVCDRLGPPQIRAFFASGGPGTAWAPAGPVALATDRGGSAGRLRLSAVGVASGDQSPPGRR